MSRVVLSGYYGFNNLGDDAVLAATVDALRARRPDVEIAVLSGAPQATGRAFDVEGVPRAGLRLAPGWSGRVVGGMAEGGEGVHLGLGLRPWQNGAWLDAGTTAARTVVERCGARWICLAMQRPGDLDLAERAAASIGSGARVVRTLLNPREMLALVSGLSLVVGMRLHALVFAATQGVPLVSLTYDPKVGAFARELGEPFLDPGRLDAPALVGMIREALAGAEQRRARVLAAVAPLRARAALAPNLAAQMVS